MSVWKPNNTIKMFFEAVLSCKNLCPSKGLNDVILDQTESTISRPITASYLP